MENIIRTYFDCWLKKDGRKLRDIFSKDIVYSECYGPEYIGIGQIEKWFEEWNKKGTVIKWDIKRCVENGNTIAVEWYFECDYEGNVDGFDGVTLATFGKDNKISDLREFQSKPQHYYPYGK